MDLQELVSRGTFIFSKSSRKFELFKLVNGRLSAKELAIKTGRHESNILNDLVSMEELELIRQKKDGGGKIARKNNSIIYEKTSLARNVPLSYFVDTIKSQKELIKKEIKVKHRKERISIISMPSESQLSQIINEEEGQLYEFKRAGADVRKLTKEIAAFSNTKIGGIIFYGIEDDGTVTGSDKKKQELDAPLMDCINRNINPPVKAQLYSKKYLGYEIILIVIPPHKKKTVHFYDGRPLIRKSTIICVMSPAETKILYKGGEII